MTAPAARPRRNRRVAKVSRQGTPVGRDSSTIACRDEKEARTDEAAMDLRRRLSCVGRLVREVFGLDHNADASLITRDAYLIVVSRIIESLTGGAQELSTAELASLSKALAEHRRLDISQMEIERRFPEQVSGRDTLEADLPQPLPQGFGRIVEQIYGTNLSKPSKDGDSDLSRT